jgi:hypothetical protein
VCFAVGMIYIKNKDLKILTFNQTMNQLKKNLGLVWIALALAAAYFASSLGLFPNLHLENRRFSIWHHHFLYSHH